MGEGKGERERWGPGGKRRERRSEWRKGTGGEERVWEGREYSKSYLVGSKSFRT